MLRQNKKIEDTIQAAYKRNRRNSPVRGQPKFGTTSRNPVSMRGQRGGSRGGGSQRLGMFRPRNQKQRDRSFVGSGRRGGRSGGFLKGFDPSGHRGATAPPPEFPGRQRGRGRRGGRGGLGLNPNAPNDVVTGKRSRRMSEGFRRYGRKAPTRKVGRGSNVLRDESQWWKRKKSGGRGGRVGTGLAGSRRRTSSGTASRLSDRQRQQMKNRFEKAAADSRSRRFGYRYRNSRPSNYAQKFSRKGIMAGDGSKALRGRNARPAPKNKPRVMGMPRQIEERYRRRR